ncbi:SPOSA6832_02821, partial [Sporobolomyces salmonicolor]
MSTAQQQQDLSDRLVKAALNDPAIYAKGFDSSRVFALISVLLNSPSSPRKRLVRSMKTVYLFHVSRTARDSGGDGDDEAVWWVDMKKKGIVRKLAKGEKAPLKPDVVIRLADRDLVGLATGTLNPQKLYDAKVRSASSVGANNPPEVDLPSWWYSQRVHVRGDIDKAFNVEKILSHERQKLESLAGPKTRDPNKERGIWAERKLDGAAPGAGLGAEVKAKL